MKVQLTTDRAGRGWQQYAGDIVEIPDDEGNRLLESNQALPVEERTIETAAIDHRSREQRKPKR